jgi:aminoglycoside phosphotransferase (APT) family kinase protein
VVVDRSIVDAASRATGTDVELVGPTRRGQSGATFDVRVGGEAAVLKVLANGPHVLDNQYRLLRLIDILRERGSPVPEYVGVASTDDVVVTVQRDMAGEMLEPGPGEAIDPDLVDAVLPALLDTVELQADAGDLAAPPWPGWLLDTLASGGDGYCLHETMHRRADTRALLQRVVAIGRRLGHGPARTTDILHFDLNPANVLHERGRLAGIVDWNVPFVGASQGDRGFDVATLLFYTYDNARTRDRLWAHASAISGPRWVAVYLAHLALRQVEWSVRHHPGSPSDRRFREIAALVLYDCETVKP